MAKKAVKSRCQASVNVQPRTGLGWKLRARRLKLCLTYEQVAEAMRIHWTTLRNWELGTGAGLENPQKTRLVRKKRFVSKFLSVLVLSTGSRHGSQDHTSSDVGWFSVQT